MNTITDGNGNTILTNVYDTNHRVVSQTLPDSGLFTFNYTVAGNMVTQTDMTAPNGAVSTWRFNPYGYISEYSTADGTTTYQMDAGSNNITSITDSLNRTTSYSYYATADARNGMVQSVTDPLNNVTAFEYEPVYGLPTKITDALGKATTIAYTFNGSKVTKTETRDSLLNLTTVNYDNYGLPVSVVDSAGNVSTLTYDAVNHNQLTTVSDPLGNSIKYGYDSYGRVAKTIDAKGNSTLFEYDSSNRVRIATDPAGNTISYIYDKNGNLVSLKDQKGNVTAYQYDNQDRVTRVTDRLGRFESYAYYSGAEITSSTGNNLKSYTNKKGQVTS